MRKIMKAVGIELSKVECENLINTENMLKQMASELDDITFVDTKFDREELALCITQFEKIVKKYALKKFVGTTSKDKTVSLDLTKKKRIPMQKVVSQKRETA